MNGSLVQVCLCSWDSTMQEIPASNSFAHPLKHGFLQKLTGRGWFYSGTWKKRYCVLDGSKFYFYENEQSKGNEKTCGVINLDYFDVCEENNVKDKKNPHVFFVGTSVRGFFDNRHQFAAETLEDMKAWIHAIHEAITEARVNRRKPGRKRHQEGKSPDLSSSSQESEGTSTACLVATTKDRVKGPQGRRLPQRKSMMPTTRSAEEVDLRQRSISLSSPETNDNGEDISSPRLHSPSDNKWLSLSMDEMDREEKEATSNKRSSSTFELPPKSEVLSTSPENLPKPATRKTRIGMLGGQHAALTKELEMKLRSGMAPGARHLLSQESEEETKEDMDSKVEKKLECLNAKVDLTKDSLSILEERVNLLAERVQTSNNKNEQESEKVNNLLQQVASTLKEAEKINFECRQALAEADKARFEYQLLSEELKNTMAKLQLNDPSDLIQTPPP